MSRDCLGMTVPSAILRVIVLGASAIAQQPADTYYTGMTLWNPAGCPIFVGKVAVGSPSDRAGVRPGDYLLAVDGTSVTEGSQASQLLRSNSAAPVTLTLLRDGKEIKVVSERVKRSSFYTSKPVKAISGQMVPDDTTQGEVDRMLAFDGKRIVARVFPTHYPIKPELFYAGFEIFILHDPTQVTVGGIEDGPASKAGVHWGDVLISVNGLSIMGKTPSELEQLFTSTQPSVMRLQVDRLGTPKTFDLHLQSAGEVARQNGHRFVEGHPVPIWATGKDERCFME